MGKSAKLGQWPNAPVFSASKTSSQTFATNASSKVIYNNEQYDTASCYDPSTARFTPNVAGYYQVNATIITATPVDGISLLSIFRNGIEHKRGGQIQATTATNNGPYGNHVSGLVFCNGTTDFIEINIYVSGAGVTADTSGVSFFDASLVRIG